MARIWQVLKAVGKASNRNSKAVRTVTGNNMFYAGATLLFMSDVSAILFFLVLMCIVLFLPSSGDPMALAPRDRLQLWPLSPREHLWLRLITPWLNPVTWIVLGGLLWKRMTWGLWAFVSAFFLLGFVGSYWRGRGPGLTKLVPSLIPGPWRQLVRKELRQILCTLDLYCALLIAAPATVLRLRGELPVDSFVPLTMMILVMMSTTALTLFGFDGEHGLTRYRLLPLAGWEILASKGVAFLAVILVLTAALAPVGGLAGGLMLLAAGHGHSVQHMIPQSRWRFRASHGFGVGIAQMILAILGCASVTQWRISMLLACAAIYVVSMWWTGRRLLRS
jgi:hypothetical protein